MQQEINLYALLPKETVSYFNRKKILTFYIAFVGLLFLLDFIHEFQRIYLKKEHNILSAEIQQQQQQLNTLMQQYPITNPDELDKQLAQLQENYLTTKMSIDLLTPYENFSSYLIALAKNTSPGVWLTEIIFNRTENKIVLIGHTLKPSMLEQFYSGLNKEPTFAGMMFDINEVKETTFPPSFNIEANGVNHA